MSGISRDYVGIADKSFIVDVEKGAIRRFCEALGETNPLYLDEEFARRHGYSGVLTPPTFPTTFRLPAPPPWLAPLTNGAILAGEQGFSYARPIVAGDRLECTLYLKDIQEKVGRSGIMQVFDQELFAVDQLGALVVRNRRVVLYKPAAVPTSSPA
ncbi:MaoC family dehydratase N-terminal domain-containing protein [Pararoseomonas sp. SCSIO 73927]|uniref:FAS1-like dehydratase domain-containing protein n=1 Tax=Pararoseomonas sp. SCSIO 73927 TaxID=3114537 RepID=UPI0030D4CA82